MGVIDLGHPKTLLRIDEMFAFIASDANGEGLPAFQAGLMMMPLVAADRKRVDSLRDIARQIARETGQTITLVRFSHREELEVIEP
jgi:hypothetical protein